VDFNIKNRFINNVYLIKEKQNVVLGNNVISIGNKKFIFDENNLLILNQNENLTNV
jgi:hypothetical protein